MKIFISYRSLDRESVRSLVHDLEDVGHEVWSDIKITGGQDWWNNVLAGIRDCDLFIFGLTPNWFESEACLREFDYATALGKNRLPVRLIDMELDTIPQQVRRLQIVDYQPNTDRSFRDLQRAINRMPTPSTIPSPLPEPPASPLEPLAVYDQQLRRLSLEREAQTAMVFELKRALRRRQNADRARQLLENLRRHPDTSDTIASRIEIALSENPDDLQDVISEEDLPPLPESKMPKRPVIREKDAAHLAELARFDLHTDTVYAVAFSPDNTLLASSSGDKTVRLWNMTDGQAFAMLRGHDAAVRDVAFSRDGKTLASSSGDSIVRLWGIGNNREISLLKGHEDWVLRVAFSPRGDVLASSSVNEMTKLWDLEKREEIATFGGHADWVTGLAFSPDGTTLATASYDGTVRFWNVARRRRMHNVINTDGMIEDIAYSPQGTTLVTAMQDGTIRLWNASRMELSAVLEGHHHTVYQVEFSPDGSLLVSCGADGTLHIWSMASRSLCAKIEAHDSPVWSVAFSPNGTMIASASEDGTLKLWGLVG